MMEASDRQQLERVVNLVREVLGPDAVAAYLFGSAVLGGLRPESDLDVLAVSKRPTTREEKRRLVDRLLRISYRKTPEGRWRHVELTVLVEGDVKPWRYPASFDFQYGDWMRDDFERGNLEPWPTRANPDLTTLIHMVRSAGVALFGPPARELFDPVPREDLVRAMVEGIDGLLADLAPDTRNVLLTFARIWSTLATGVIRSKDAAADWVLERLPAEHRPVMVHAREIYLGHRPERWDGLEVGVRPCADRMIGEIRALTAG